MTTNPIDVQASPITSSARASITLETIVDARTALNLAWPVLVAEARQVLAGELHYQAMAYHAFRQIGVPLTQMGMNVKMLISEAVSPHFIALEELKHEDFRSGFEPIPDLVLFRPAVARNWQRRSNEKTLREMMLAVEIKASERFKSRLGRAEIERDLIKLEAHRIEAQHRSNDFLPVMMIIDTAMDPKERMQPAGLEACRKRAAELGIGFYYVSQERDYTDEPPLPAEGIAAL